VFALVSASEDYNYFAWVRCCFRGSRLVYWCFTATAASLVLFFTQFVVVSRVHGAVLL